MADELIDIVDENNNLTGEQKMKSEAHRDGLWHRAAHIWIYNSKGEVLLQLRAKDKALGANVWDLSAAGHIGAGEEPITSALREIHEEIGLMVRAEDLEPYRVISEQTRFKEIVNNEFYYVYLLKYDGDAGSLKIQEEELQKVEFIPIEDIEKGLKENPEKYFPHKINEYWGEMLNAIKTKLE
ncbi:MAG: NUDIX domain-containing protein [Patescibacteria group bacterium]|nr:NUDIX domain-containing protein [Patescibacteria group bacterium]